MSLYQVFGLSCISAFPDCKPAAGSLKEFSAGGNGASEVNRGQPNRKETLRGDAWMWQEPTERVHPHKTTILGGIATNKIQLNAYFQAIITTKHLFCAKLLFFAV